MSDKKTKDFPNDDDLTLDVEGFGQAQEDAKRPPLPNAKWLFEIDDYTVKRSKKNDLYVTFNCKVIDDDPVYNGRFVRSGPCMLQGAGLPFFVGDGAKPGFVETITPSRTWDVKKGIRLVEANGRSAYLDSFAGCKFAAMTTIDYIKVEGTQDNKLNDDGQPIPSGWNSMCMEYFSVK